MFHLCYLKSAIVRVAIATVLLLIMSTGSANETISAETLVFAGVRIGFSAEQTIEALAKTYSIDPEEFSFIESTDPVAGLGKTVFGITYKSPKLRIRANFYPDLRKTPVLDTGLTFLQVVQLVAKKSSADAKNLAYKLVGQIQEKIGDPTMQLVPNRFLWCSVLNEEKTRCLEDTVQMGVSSNFYPAGVTVFLEDFSAGLVFEEAVKNK